MNTYKDWGISLNTFDDPIAVWGRTITKNPKVNSNSFFYDNLPVHLQSGLLKADGTIDKIGLENFFNNKAQEVINGIVSVRVILKEGVFALMPEVPTQQYLKWCVYQTVNFALDGSTYSEQTVGNKIATSQLTISDNLSNFMNSQDAMSNAARRSLMLSNIHKYSYKDGSIIYDGEKLNWPEGYIFDKKNYFTHNAEKLTKNDSVATDAASIGSAYKGTQHYGTGASADQFYGSLASGDQFYGSRATGKQYYGYGANNDQRYGEGASGDQLYGGLATGGQYYGHGASGNFEIGKTAAGSSPRMYAGSGSNRYSTFKEIIDSVKSSSGVPANDSITTAMLKNAAITTDKIENLAITYGKIAANSVGMTEIRDMSVDAAKIKDKTITKAKMVDGVLDDNAWSAYWDKDNSFDIKIGTYPDSGSSDNIGFYGRAGKLINAANKAKTFTQIINSVDVADKNKTDIANLPQGGGGGLPGNNSITTAMIKNKAITYEKIADNAISNAKIHNDGISWNKIYNVGTAHYTLPDNRWGGGAADWILHIKVAKPDYFDIVIKDKTLDKTYIYNLKEKASDSALAKYFIAKYLTIEETAAQGSTDTDIYIYSKLNISDATVKGIIGNLRFVVVQKIECRPARYPTIRLTGNTENNPTPLPDNYNIEFNKVQMIAEISQADIQGRLVSSISQLDNEKLYRVFWTENTGQLEINSNWSGLKGGNYQLKLKIVFLITNRDINVLWNGLFQFKGGYVYSARNDRSNKFTSTNNKNIIGRVNNSNSTDNITEMIINFSIFKIRNSNYIRISDSKGIAYDGNNGVYDLYGMGRLIGNLKTFIFSFQNYKDNLKFSDIGEIFITFKKLEGGV